MKTVFIGNFVSVLKVVHSETNLNEVIVEKNNFSDEFQMFCTDKKIKVYEVENLSDIERHLINKNYLDVVCFVASFGIIFSMKIINSFKKIVNFHPGDVFTCRGRHPLPFAIKKRLPMMAITAHYIDSEKIDCGPIIAQQFIPIDYNSDYKYNEKILLSTLEYFSHSVILLMENQFVVKYDWSFNFKSKYNKKLLPHELDEIFNAKKLEDIL